jgi:hypothetical protein
MGQASGWFFQKPGVQPSAPGVGVSLGEGDTVGDGDSEGEGESDSDGDTEGVGFVSVAVAGWPNPTARTHITAARSPPAALRNAVLLFRMILLPSC